MSYVQAVVLGIVQGLSEFLPISSSAHLVLIPWMAKWGDQGLAVDVALHWGTLAAVLAYFWKDWFALAKAALKREHSSEHRLFWGIALGTLPAALAGLFLDDLAETAFRSPHRIAWPLMIFGVLLWLADRWGRKNKTIKAMDLKACILVGLAQALALVPGVSRSGITITAALFLGFERKTAARFSFLLSVPIVLAAGVLKLKDLGPAAASGSFWAGVLAAALSGYGAIRFLLGYVQKKDMGVFAFYRVLLGVLVLLLWAGNPHRLSAKLLREALPAQMSKSENMSSEARHLHAHVSMLAGTIGERNPFNRPALDQAQRYIEKQFRSLGLKPMVQEYRSDGLSMIDDGTVFYNVEARLGEGAGRPVLVIGAHYDSAPGTPGADDNASGTAALLELARQLKDKPLTREIRLVAFSNEEPPAFFTRNMGSFHYAQALKKEGRPVIGMISLEMLGYYNDSPGSQIYPPFLSLFYPKEGNFIGLVGNLPSRRFLKACRQAWQGASDFPLETAALPGFISATVLSDHFNFQRAGFPGLMLTDTAFYRNPHYHEATDTPQRLDYERMAKLLEALSGMALTLAK